MNLEKRCKFMENSSTWLSWLFFFFFLHVMRKGLIPSQHIYNLAYFMLGHDLFKSSHSNLSKLKKKKINSLFRLAITTKKRKISFVSVKTHWYETSNKQKSEWEYKLKWNELTALTQIVMILDTDSVLLCWNYEQRPGMANLRCTWRCTSARWSALINK